MQVSVSEAKAQLTELVRRVEGGEEVVLTRHGKAAVRLVAVDEEPSAADRDKLIDMLQEEIEQLSIPRISAARSQDFLYDSNGLPA